MFSKTKSGSEKKNVNCKLTIQQSLKNFCKNLGAVLPSILTQTFINEIFFSFYKTLRSEKSLIAPKRTMNQSNGKFQHISIV